MASRSTSSLLVSAVLLAALPAPGVAALGSESIVSMKIDPAEVSVNTFYSGVTVYVEGTIPAGYDAAILCSGEEGSVALKRKGKVLGLLWMSVGDVVFENVPSVYVLSTSGPLSGLAPSPVLEKLGVGYPALESRVVQSSGQTGLDRDFGEFLKLKESENLYSYHEGGVELEPGPSGTMRVSAECLMPTKTPWGEYEVRLFGFKAGIGELLRAERLQVVPVGMTARISNLAQNHGLLYGILAVIIALGVGLLTGLAFARMSKKGD